MKKLLGILVLGLLWSNSGNATEYCSSLNESKKILDIRAKSYVDLIFLGEELACIGKLKEVKIYSREFLNAQTEWVNEIVPMYPKGSKNRFKICGQIHLNDDIDNLSDPEKAKKYHKCEEERIKKAEENTITYLYNLFYKLKDQ